MSEESILSEVANTEAPVENTSGGTWRESLPEDLREAGALRDIPDVNTLAKAYTDAQSYIGRSIRIPGDDAGDEVWSDFTAKLTNVPGIARVPTEDSSDEDWSAFYSRMGRPETPDAYNIKRQEGLEWSDAEDALLSKLHEIGLNNRQASDLVNWMNEGVTEVNQDQERSRDAALAQLKDDWGQAFDSKISDAKAALNHFGDAQLMAELDASGLGNNVALIKAFAEIGKGFSEDPAMSTGDRRAMAVTPAEARMQIDEILANPTHPYNDANNPGHDAAILRMSKLYQAAYSSDESAEPDMFERRLAAIG